MRERENDRDAKAPTMHEFVLPRAKSNTYGVKLDKHRVVVSVASSSPAFMHILVGDSVQQIDGKYPVSATTAMRMMAQAQPYCVIEVKRKPSFKSDSENGQSLAHRGGFKYFRVVMAWNSTDKTPEVGFELRECQHYCIVSRVAPNSLSSYCLRKDDYILEVDGMPVGESKEAMKMIVKNKDIRNHVSLVIERPDCGAATENVAQSTSPEVKQPADVTEIKKAGGVPMSRPLLKGGGENKFTTPTRDGRIKKTMKTGLFRKKITTESGTHIHWRRGFKGVETNYRHNVPATTAMRMMAQARPYCVIEVKRKPSFKSDSENGQSLAHRGGFKYFRVVMAWNSTDKTPEVGFELRDSQHYCTVSRTLPNALPSFCLRENDYILEIGGMPVGESKEAMKMIVKNKQASDVPADKELGHVPRKDEK